MQKEKERMKEERKERKGQRKKNIEWCKAWKISKKEG